MTLVIFRMYGNKPWLNMNSKKYVNYGAMTSEAALIKKGAILSDSEAFLLFKQFNSLNL